MGSPSSAGRAVVGGMAGGPAGSIVGASQWGEKIQEGVEGAGGFGGNSQDAGILGVGQYKAKEYDVNKDAFSNAESINRQNEFARQLNEAKARTAPTATAKTGSAAAINMTPQDQFRAGQMQLAGQLQDQSMGLGPSLAQSQLRQATDRNIQQSMALAASQRGANPTAGLRQAQMMAAGANQQAAAQAADIRMQEQLSARQQLAGVLGQGRGADIGLATDQAGLQQQMSLANQQAQNQMALANQQAALQQTSLNDQQARFYNTGLSDMTQRDREAQMAYEQMRVNQQTGMNSINQQAYQSASQARGNMVGGMGQGIAAIAMSDEDEKEEIKPGENKTMEFLNKISKSTEVPKSGSGNPYQGQNDTGNAMGKGLGAMLGLGGGEAAAASAAPAAAAASDKNAKKDISEGDDKLKAFIEGLRAHEYKYKDPKNGPGTYVSPMAQEIEKTELGKHMVIDTPNGKMVDYARAGGTMLAAAAMLNDRVNDLESQLSKAFAAHKGGKK
jgi:hypothetical protein